MECGLFTLCREDHYCEPSTFQCHSCTDICHPDRSSSTECRNLCPDVWNRMSAGRAATTTTLVTATRTTTANLNIAHISILLLSLILFIIFVVFLLFSKLRKMNCFKNEQRNGKIPLQYLLSGEDKTTADKTDEAEKWKENEDIERLKICEGREDMQNKSSERCTHDLVSEAAEGEEISYSTNGKTLSHPTDEMINDDNLKTGEQKLNEESNLDRDECQDWQSKCITDNKKGNLSISAEMTTPKVSSDEDPGNESTISGFILGENNNLIMINTQVQNTLSSVEPLQPGSISSVRSSNFSTTTEDGGSIYFDFKSDSATSFRQLAANRGVTIEREQFGFVIKAYEVIDRSVENLNFIRGCMITNSKLQVFITRTYDLSEGREHIMNCLPSDVTDDVIEVLYTSVWQE